LCDWFYLWIAAAFASIAATTTLAAVVAGFFGTAGTTGIVAGCVSGAQPH
jgi:hypothetical protein